VYLSPLEPSPFPLSVYHVNAARKKKKEIRVQCFYNRYPTEFQVTTTEQLDHESRSMIDTELMCWDAGQPSLMTRKVLPVRVLDANDNRPTFTSTTYTARLVENNYVGTAVLQVS